MIPRSADWKHALADAVRDPAELLALLDLPPDLLAGCDEPWRHFPLRVPRGFVARMRKGDPDDPLLRQILARADETAAAPPGYLDDPVGDLAARRRPGLLHKYRGRVLLIVTGACALHCRYCFRRHFPYGAENAAPADWSATLDYLRGDPSIEEVILSGGDPLMLDDRRLGALAEELAAIPHLKRLRLHTRLPIVLPERVEPRLVAWLTRSRLQPVVVLHANHPREIDDSVTAALEPLRAARVTLLNQAVLLRGVNDSAEIQCGLSEALFRAGVLPYYLHLLDRVRGAAHFEVSEARAREILAKVRGRVPGYLVPRLVREIQGRPAKVPLSCE